MQRTVKITNPNNNARIFANSTVTVEGPARPNGLTGEEQTMVRVTPSMRRGMDHDLATYPTSWIHE